jgi:uncharacterized protein YqhQ
MYEIFKPVKMIGIVLESPSLDAEQDLSNSTEISDDDISSSQIVDTAETLSTIGELMTPVSSLSSIVFSFAIFSLVMVLLYADLKYTLKKCYYKHTILN